MNEKFLPLNELEIGKKGVIVSLLSKDDERRRMLDLGLIKGTVVKAVQKSPCGDPVAYFIRGTLIAIRSDDASKCLINVLN